ncbi:hypothetical protein CPB84DRAFT_238827 [Gymnopilus junonius]|uniref:Uncharacterized protein n=1 Tax=Gymnopilus junonius TaxID=109634 RepID=A0A9P5NSQ6_GYMJU|nr:hypothetical protein CPB84DRAFT_238827 [Gymnopilus junonius]
MFSLSRHVHMHRSMLQHSEPRYPSAEICVTILSQCDCSLMHGSPAVVLLSKAESRSRMPLD